MKNYLLTVILTSVSVGISEILVPDKSGISKYVKMLGILIILSAAISPLGNIFSNIDGGWLNSLKNNIIYEDIYTEEYNVILSKYISEHMVSDVENVVKKSIVGEFNIADEECEVNVIFKTVDSDINIDEIIIILSGSAIFKNPYMIEDYVRRTYGYRGFVVIE